MKTLIFVLGFVIACSKETVEKASETGTIKYIEEEEEVKPAGVIPADDCQQVNRGDKACNFTLFDQNGEVWELYDHQGNVILLDFSTMWCPPCQAAGHYMQPLQDDYASQNVQVVTVLIDGPSYGVAPTEKDVDDWATQHNVTTAPVLQGSRELMYDSIGLEGYLIGSYPTYIYIDRNMKFYNAHVGYNDEYARQTIEEGLNL